MKKLVDKRPFRVYPNKAREKTIVFERMMRSCWNWQTGMTKDHVSTDVRVQVSYSASSEWALRTKVRRAHFVFGQKTSYGSNELKEEYLNAELNSAFKSFRMIFLRSGKS